MNVYLSLEGRIWDPIVVHKVGEQYYVEDGHHRVSVARSLGRTFIEAKVWEYPVQIMQAEMISRMECCPEEIRKAYAAD